MRDSLRKSVDHSPAKGFERYPKGSVVLCNACAKPVFKLDASVSLGDKAGQAARAFKPLAVADMLALAEREDIDRGVIALVRSMTLEQMQAHVATLREMKTGDPMMCPSCGDCFVQVLSVERNEAIDRSYTVELLTVPPFGAGRQSPVRGKRLGFYKDWIN
jgi:hypothetical protein